MAEIITNATAENIDFTVKFNAKVQALLDLLGMSDVQTLAPGSAMNIYKTSGTLQTSQVGATEEINPSTYTNTVAETKVLEVKKYYKLTGVEDVIKYGADIAVNRSDDALIRDIQKAVKTSIFAGIKTGTGSATGENFQKALANGWGKLNVAFDSEEATPVYFANPLDVADYLGNATVTMQTAFGLSYISNFLGLGTVIVDNDVDQGKIYATATENINVVTADLAGLPTSEGFYTDESGLIGIKHSFADNRASETTLAVTGLVVFPSYLDRIIVSTIQPGE